MRITLLGLALLFAADDKDCFPMKQGTEWTYVWEDKKEDVVTAGEAVEEEDLQYVIFNFDVQDHASKRTECYGVTEEGVLYYGTGDEEDPWSLDDIRENPRMILKFGGKKGDKWEWTPEEGKPITYEHLGEEEVEVPAGKYKAVKIVHTGVVAGMKNVTTEWYAKGVGLVKYVDDIEGTKSVKELKKVK